MRVLMLLWVLIVVVVGCGRSDATVGACQDRCAEAAKSCVQGPDQYRADCIVALACCVAACDSSMPSGCVPTTNPPRPSH